MEPGTGKTWIAINLWGRLWYRKDVRRVLYVGPRPVLSTIAEEINKHLHPMVQRKVVVLAGHRMKLKKKKQILSDLKRGSKYLTIVLINYESAWRLKKELSNWGPHVITADESHKIKRYSSKQTRGMLALAPRAQYRQILTGTAITKNHLDIREQWRFMVGPRNYPNRHWVRINDFRDWYARRDIFGRVRKLRHVKEMRKIIRSQAIVLTKEDCLDLPEKIYQTIHVDLDPATVKIYKEMAEHMYTELITAQAEDPIIATASIVLVMRLRLSQITSGFIKDEDGGEREIGDEKYKALQQLVESIVLENQRKLVVFTRFNHELRRIEALLTKMGLSFATISGSVDDDTRDRARMEFQERTDPRVLLVNVQTGGLGITLTAAREAVFFNIPQGLDHYIQAQDRIHRIGQEHKVTYYNLIGRGTIDEETLKALETKKDIADVILGDPSKLLYKEYLIDNS